MKISICYSLLIFVFAVIGANAQSPEAAAATDVPPPQAPATKPELANPAQGNEQKPAAPAVGADGKTEAPPNEPGATAPTDAFVYDPTGKRDPFEPDLPREAIQQPKVIQETPVTQEETAEQQTPKQTRPLEPLEAYDLSQLKVSAIIWDTKNPRAMITDPQRGTHYVKLKTRIGRHNGFIAAIREGEIVVVEYGQENGQYTKYFKILELR